MRVVIAEDSVLLREGVANLLQNEGFEIVGRGGDADELLRQVRSHRPDVAIVDVRMPPTHTDEGARAAVPAVRSTAGSSRALAGRVALACVIGGVGLLTFADASWAHAVGVVLLFTFTLTCFAAIAPATLAAQEERGQGDPRS